MAVPPQLTMEGLDEVWVEGVRGRVAARVGLLLTFYLKGPTDSQKRSALGAWINSYLTMTEGRLRWSLPTGGGRWRDLRKEPMPDIAAQVGTMDPADEFDFVAHSGEKSDDAGHYYAVALSPSSLLPDNLGFVSLGLPFSWAARSKPGAFRELVVAGCRELSPFHGYAGLAVLQSPDHGTAMKAEPFVFPLIQQFPGLEFDQPVSHSLICKDGIKGINWLTAVSDVLLDRIGGREKAREVLAGGAIQFFDYPGGLIIQAGQVPQFGDSANRLIPPDYQKVARFLKPIRSPYNDMLLETPPGIDRFTFAQQWLARFDGNFD